MRDRRESPGREATGMEGRRGEHVVGGVGFGTSGPRVRACEEIAPEAKKVVSLMWGSNAPVGLPCTISGGYREIEKGPQRTLGIR